MKQDIQLVIVLEYFYNKDRPIGGAERQINKLAQKLIGSGLDVRLVTGQWKWGEPSHEIVNGIPVYRVFTCWGMFNIRGVRKFGHYSYLAMLLVYLWRHRNKYNFIHCHSAMQSAFITSIAGKFLNKKTLARPMASGPTWGDIARMQAQQSVMGSQLMLNKFKDIDVYIALNEDVVTELKNIDIEPDRIFRMPNGVETDDIPFKSDYSTSDEVKITFVGRLHPQKGVETLLDAFHQALEQNLSVNLQLQLVGTGPIKDTLENKAKTLGIADKVTFFGQVDNVYPILHESDIFVLPSRAEGMSNALLEGMACGLPSIVSNIPANKALIENKKNGLLAEVDDPQSLSEAIILLATDNDLREKLGRAARKLILEEYSIDSITERFITLYHSTLQKQSITSNVPQTSNHP